MDLKLVLTVSYVYLSIIFFFKYSLYLIHNIGLLHILYIQFEHFICINQIIYHVFEQYWYAVVILFKLLFFCSPINVYFLFFFLFYYSHILLICHHQNILMIQDLYILIYIVDTVLSYLKLKWNQKNTLPLFLIYFVSKFR